MPGIHAKVPIYTSALNEYMIAHSLNPNPALKEARMSAIGDPWEFMQTSQIQTSFLYLLCRMLRACRILEIGCYFGHSTIAMASAIQKEGKVISIDHNPQWAKVAQDNFNKAGVTDRVEFCLGEALDVLKLRREEFSSAPFDLVFIDADKKNAALYWSEVRKYIRPGGLIVADNVLWRGKIIDPLDQSDRARALRELNSFAIADIEFEVVILPISDGMLLARRK
jgi:predicted O-methyltransferase YrrM